jgi:hypothetical protein
MSETWNNHYRQISDLIASRPVQRYTPPPAPAPAPAPGWEDALRTALEQFQTGGEGMDAAGVGAPDGGGGGRGWTGGFPNTSTISSMLDINPGLARAGMIGLGLLSGPVGTGLSALNTMGNVANTVSNTGMLGNLGVNPGFGSTLGGLLGFNGLSGNFTSALNAAMANNYSGFANLSSPQAPGDMSGMGGWGDIAAAMDAAAAEQNAASGSGAYDGQGPGQAVQGEVTAEPLGGFQKGGYTGAGRDGVVQPHKPAGIVHEGELVIPHHVVKRMGLLG